MMKIIRFLAIFLFLGSACLTAVKREPKPSVRSFKVNDRITRLLVHDYVNMFVFSGPDGSILIDTGFEPVKLIEKELRRIGIKKIHYIINTHSNGDHFFGNVSLGKDGVIISHSKCRQRMAKREGFSPEGLPGMVFNDRVTICFNGEEINLIHMPGHTDNDIVVYLKKAKIVFVGDLVFSDSFPGSQIANGGNVFALEKTIFRLTELFPPDVRFLVGHGRDYSMGDMKKYHQMTRKTIDIVTPLIEQGLTPDQIKSRQPLKDWESWNSQFFPGEITTETWIDNIHESYINHHKSKPMNKPHLGQEPPGMVPVVFAPGIVNTDDKNHSSVAVSPDGKEIYWSLFSTMEEIRMERIWHTKTTGDGLWTGPKVAPFSGGYRDGQPSFSPDGKRIYFSSLRPVGPNDDSVDANIWYVEKKNGNWGSPRCLDSTVNTEHHEWFPTVAKNGNIYFGLKRKGSKIPWNIHVSKYIDGQYIKPEPMGTSINSRFNEMTPYIHPDEKYIIFFSERPSGNFIDGRLYISFQKSDGSWTEAEKMGFPVNTAACRFPSISPDGKYFFFTKLNGESEDVLWVETEAVAELRERYLGEIRTGNVPELFAPQIVKNCPNFSLSGDTVCFSGQDRSGILFSYRQGQKWTDPVLVDFFQKKFSDFNPFMTPDEKILVFSTNRPEDGAVDLSSGYNLFISRKNGNSWGNPRSMGKRVNSEMVDGCPVLTKSGNLYFFSNRDGDNNIYRSKYIDGRYEKAQKLPPPVNSEMDEVDPFVAWDESYMILCISGRRDSAGKNDLYISFHDDNDQWLEPVNLGDHINSEEKELFPRISPDGKFFFFSSNKTGKYLTYWVDAKIIGELKPESALSLTGSYLGQKPPGMTPEVFAPGIISHGFHELGISISPNGDEIFYITSDRDYKLYQIIRLKRNGNRWMSPEVAPFSGFYTDNSLCFSVDGSGLYFRSKRPRPHEKKKESEGDFWKVKKKNGKWSEPEWLKGPINTDKNELSLSVSSSGTIYFAARYEPKHGGDIHRSVLENDQYSLPEKIEGGVSTEYGEGRPYISPDESYLLFQSNRPGSLGQNDLYVSFKEKNGGWGKPVNLGEPVNSTASEFSPYVSPDGKYLFFSSYRPLKKGIFKGKSYEKMLKLYRHPQNGYATIYWVDAKIIADLKQKSPDGRAK